MRALLVLMCCAGLLRVQAQLVNGSFEDELGNYTATGWMATCAVLPGPAAPGCGGSSILVPHSNAPGCGWSRLDQLVPFIGMGRRGRSPAGAPTSPGSGPTLTAASASG